MHIFIKIHSVNLEKEKLRSVAVIKRKSAYFLIPEFKNPINSTVFLFYANKVEIKQRRLKDYLHFFNNKPRRLFARLFIASFNIVVIKINYGRRLSFKS